MAPITTNAYQLDASGEFRPHLSIYDEPEPDLAFRETWKVLQSYPIGQ